MSYISLSVNTIGKCMHPSCQPKTIDKIVVQTCFLSAYAKNVIGTTEIFTCLGGPKLCTFEYMSGQFTYIYIYIYIYMMKIFGKVDKPNTYEFKSNISFIKYF